MYLKQNLSWLHITRTKESLFPMLYIDQPNEKISKAFRMTHKTNCNSFEYEDGNKDYEKLIGIATWLIYVKQGEQAFFSTSNM
jgi:hypothetical protein